MFFKTVILILENYNRLNTVSETHQNDQVNGIFLFANALHGQTSQIKQGTDGNVEKNTYILPLINYFNKANQ